MEAARAALLRELQAIISSDTSDVNVRHLTLLVDYMTGTWWRMCVFSTSTKLT